MLIVYLDPYHLGDPLFLTQLARDLAHRGGGALLVHTSGEAGERALEATGAIATKQGDVWQVQTVEEATVVERATRELNRQIVHELNEAGVSAVRVMGADRGLLKQVDGTVVAAGTKWIHHLVGQGVVAVLATLVESADEGSDAEDASAPLREVDPIAALAVLATSLGAAGAEPRVRILATSSGASTSSPSAVDRLKGLGIDAEWLAIQSLRTADRMNNAS